MTRLEKYEEQLGILGERNSYPITDAGDTILDMVNDEVNWALNTRSASTRNKTARAARCEEALISRRGTEKIEIDYNLNRLRQIARDKLLSEQRLKNRSKRPIEPEAVFGQLKPNNLFSRFTFCGMDKVLIEPGLMPIGHNLRKLFARGVF